MFSHVSPFLGQYLLWMVNPAPVEAVSGVSHYFVRREKPSELALEGVL